MGNRLQDWIYEKGGWWFSYNHLITRVAKREGRFVCRGVRWLWLTKLMCFITGRKRSYYKWLRP